MSKHSNSLGLFLGHFCQYFVSGDMGIATATQEFIQGVGFESVEPFDVHILIWGGGHNFEPGQSLPEFSNKPLGLDKIPFKTELVMDVFEAQIYPGRVTIYTAPVWGLAENFFKVAEEMKRLPIYSLGIIEPNSNKVKILGRKTRNLRTLAKFAKEELLKTNYRWHNLTPHRIFVIWKLVKLQNGEEQTWQRLKDAEVDRLLSIE